jgi:DinB superfamily
VATPRDEASPPWCLRLVSELHDADARATALAKTLTPQQLNWKPGPDLWSVGQCLEHLCVASDVYLPAISNALANRQLGVTQEITPGWFGRWFIRNYIEPSPQTRRASAPKKTTPGTQIDATILQRFLTSNDRAREVTRQAAPYDVNRIRFRNPFIPGLRFTVGTGLEILSRHQRRHLLQAERIQALLFTSR